MSTSLIGHSRSTPEVDNNFACENSNPVNDNGDNNEDNNENNDNNDTTTTTKKHRNTLSEEQKKSNHIRSENRRRELIRSTFDKLVELVPDLEPKEGRSELIVLNKTSDFIKLLREENIRLRRLKDQKGL
ncbi:Ino4 protein [Pichia kluyveri]|uniref:Ino4 protein n=1 Tax=Pichia kluyveri TaxID=36015 RepID=A0AAV5QX55_PICKL|nr:Ino4 protein [Pichia kluyveri]